MNYFSTASGSVKNIAGSLTVDGDLTIGATGKYGWSDDADTYINRSAADTVNLRAGGQVQIQLAGGSTALVNPTVPTGDLTMGAGAQILADAGVIGAPGIAFSGDADTGLYPAAANTLRTVVGGVYGSQWTSALQAQNGAIYATTRFVLSEVAAPGAASAGQVWIYARDNGGKTELTAAFDTLPAQTVAAEP